MARHSGQHRNIRQHRISSVPKAVRIKLLIGFAVWVGARSGCAAKKTESVSRTAAGGAGLHAPAPGPVPHARRADRRRDRDRGKIDQRTRRVIPKRADGTTFTYTESLAVPVEKAGGRQESWSEQPPSSVSESGRPHLRHPRAPRGGRRSGQERRTTVGEMEHGLSQKAVEIPFHFLELLVGLV